MSKRLIQECDLCKGEYDPDDTHSIAVKKKGKAKANAYDLCPDCAEKIQQQLVAKSSDALPEGWQFAEVISDLAEFVPPAPVRGSRRAEVTAEQQEDNDLIARKEAEREAALREAGQSIPKQAEAREVPYETVEPMPLEDGSCPHMNRGPIRPNAQGQFLQECRDCDASLEPNSSSERGSYMNATPGKGVTLSTHASDKRNRD